MLEVGDAAARSRDAAGVARSGPRSSSRPRSSPCSRRSCAGRARCSRGCSCSSRPGTSSTRTARTWSTSTSAICARRSTGLSASSRSRRCAAPATGCERTATLSRLPIRLRLTLVFASRWRRARRRGLASSTCASASSSTTTIDHAAALASQDVAALVRRDARTRVDAAASSSSTGESFAEVLDPRRQRSRLHAPIGHDRLLSPSEVAAGAARGPSSSTGPLLRAATSDAPARAARHSTAGSSWSSSSARRGASAETLHSLRDALLIGGPVALLLASLAGYVARRGCAAAGRGDATPRGRDLGVDRSDERLPVPPTRDEVARLGETLNEMLSRIGEASQHERRFVADASHELRTPLAMLQDRARAGAADGRARPRSSRRRSVPRRRRPTGSPARRRPAAARPDRARALPLRRERGRRRRRSRLGRSALPAARRARAAGARGRRR